MSADRAEEAATTGAVRAVVVWVALGAVMLATTLFRRHTPQLPGPWLLLVILVAWVPLLARDRRPLAVLAVVVAAESVHLALLPRLDGPTALTLPYAMGAYQPVPLATMAAAYTVSTRCGHRTAWAAGAGAGALLLVVALATRPLDLLATALVMVELVVLATAAGTVVTVRREREADAARVREAQLHERVTDERLRIAHELHDALTHRLALVNAQAGVAEYLLDTDPVSARTALHDIGTHARQALDELRATVGVLRRPASPDEPDGADATDTGPDARRPLPGVDGISELVSGFRSAAGPAALTTAGVPAELDTAVGLAAYRIVQEALTNAAKHAPGAAVDVVLRWEADHLDLTVTNAPAAATPARPGPAAPRLPGSGLGLVGMRERARACSGTLSAGPTPQGGFAVRVRLPHHVPPDRSSGA